MNQPPVVKLTADRQLWVVCHADWSLPVYFAPSIHGEEPCDYIVPAIELTGTQYSAFRDFIHPRIAHDYGVWWLLRAGSVSKLAVQAPGITVSLYVKWPGVVPESATPKIPQSLPEEETDPLAQNNDYGSGQTTRETDAFIAAIEKTGIGTNGQIRAFWMAAQKVGADWIYRKQRAIPFGFARIFAVPYRVNWKNVVLADYPDLIGIFRKSRAERDLTLASHQFSARIRSTDLTGYDPAFETIHWTVEAAQTLEWDSYVKSAEKRQRKALNAVGYTRRWGLLLNRIQKNIYDLLDSFLHQIARPNAALDNRSFHSGPTFVRDTAGIRKTRETYRADNRRLVYHDPVDVVTGPLAIGAGEAPSTPRSLQQLPVIRFDPQDLRDAGRDDATIVNDSEHAELAARDDKYEHDG